MVDNLATVFRSLTLLNEMDKNESDNILATQLEEYLRVIIVQYYKGEHFKQYMGYTLKLVKLNKSPFREYEFTFISNMIMFSYAGFGW